MHERGVPVPKRLLVLLAAAGLVSSLTAPAAGAAAPGGQPQAAAQPGTHPAVITLVTGDRVIVTSGAGGRQQVATVAAPGRPRHGFLTRRLAHHLYVVPRDVAALLPGVLDPALFDVNLLAEQRYDDRHSASLPLIVAAAPGALPVATRTATLPTLAASAQNVRKRDTARLGARLAAQAHPAAGTVGAATAPVRRIWLDRRVRAVLDHNLEQVRAPTAWHAGFDGAGVRVAVIDTGVDATHPDLRGKVALARNFTDSRDVADHFGHGTHVAATIAGTGAASQGARRGVAFAATLLSAKVLDDNGYGTFSSVIRGMEWSAAHGARVANMSLGSGEPSDGTDPVSQAVDRLTARYHTLFVVAAGNSGPTPASIGSPAAADAAVTVGAVDGTDALADFSSRGPRVGDYAIKPDITAPGVDIIEARAAGTSLGEPVGRYYTKLSGTSMATPHVAGAAALLLQRNPGATPAEVKDELVGTAHVVPGQSVFEQGGGRLDVAAATTGGIRPDQGPVSIGYFRYPQRRAHPVSRRLAWTNTGTTAVTLDLGLTLRRDAGATPAGLARLSAASVHLAPGARAAVTLTVDAGPASRGGFGLYSGWVAATVRGTATSVHAPFGFYKEPERYDLRLRVVNRRGERAADAVAAVFNVDDVSRFAAPFVPLRDGTATLRVPPGRYYVSTDAVDFDQHRHVIAVSHLTRPEVSVVRNTTVLADARTASPVRLGVRRVPTAVQDALFAEQRTDASGNVIGSAQSAPVSDISRVYVAATRPVRVGTFDTYTSARLVAPPITLDPFGLAPLHPTPVLGAAAYVGAARLRVVDAGAGTFANARGGLALVARTRRPLERVLADARAAGVALVAVYDDVPGPWLGLLARPSRQPAVTLPRAEGLALRRALARRPVYVDAVGRDVSPYAYDLVFPHRGGWERVRHVVAGAALTPVDVAVHRLPGESSRVFYGAGRGAVVPGFHSIFAAVEGMPRPFQRPEYVTRGAQWAPLAFRVGFDRSSEEPVLLALLAPVTTYARGARERWFRLPLHSTLDPGSIVMPPAVVARDATHIFAWPALGDADGHVDPFLTFDPRSAPRLTLRRDGRVVGSVGEVPAFFSVPRAPASYALTFDLGASGLLPAAGRSSTTWTFRSAAGVARPPLLVLGYDAPVRLDGTLAATTLGVTVGPQPGARVARIAGLAVSVSTDGGRGWRAATVRRVGAQTFEVTLGALPHGASVSLRAEATDAAGSAVTQVIYDALRTGAAVTGR